MSERPSWDHYFMEIARSVAKRSTCPRAPDGGVGCVIVDRVRNILSTGYVGSIKGLTHCTDEGAGGGCLIDENTKGCIRTVHAEMNAILRSHGHPWAAYCTLSPCIVCFKLLLQAGVTKIYYAKEYRLGVDDHRRLLEDYGEAFPMVHLEGT